MKNYNPIKEPIQYRGYTIQMDNRNPYGKAEFMYYPTDEGISHDASCDDGESFSYCGNCRWAESLEDAIDDIFDIVERENTLKP